MNNINLIPVISEKSLQQAELKEYLFFVDQRATKHHIKDAVEKYFKVTVKDVRTKLVRGKTKRVGKKSVYIQTQDRKIAIVKVGEKDKIELFDTQESKKGGKKA